MHTTKHIDSNFFKNSPTQLKFCLLHVLQNCVQVLTISKSITFSRGHAHCKILHKYCIFGCHTHFGHITVSPYAKWLNTDSASYRSLVAAASLNTRSICKLCDLSRGSALLPATTSPVNEGQNLDDEINAQTAVFWSVGYAFFVSMTQNTQFRVG